MDITRWSTPKSDWLHSLQPKMEKLYTVSKTRPGADLAEITNSLLPNSDLNWREILDQIRSVTQLCPTPCDPMNCSTPGLPVHHQLPELTQNHIHRVSDAIQPSHPLSSPSPPAPNPSQHQSLFLCCWKRMFAMTSVFSLQNSVSLCPASLCTPRLNIGASSQEYNVNLILRWN